MLRLSVFLLLMATTTAHVSTMKKNGNVFKYVFNIPGMKNPQWNKSADAQLDHIKTDLASVKAKLETVQTELSAVNSTVTNNVEQFVSFQVKAKELITIVQKNEVLKFDTVTLNTGGAYHATTGIFHAPVTGMYLFWANVMSVDLGAVNLILFKEGVKQVRGFSGRDLRHGTATINYIMKVNRGEKVWFTKTYGTLNIHGNYISMYGGLLLHAL